MSPKWAKRTCLSCFALAPLQAVSKMTYSALALAPLRAPLWQMSQADRPLRAQPLARLAALSATTRVFAKTFLSAIVTLPRKPALPRASLGSAFAFLHPSFGVKALL
jgi:hypothetical protein